MAIECPECGRALSTVHYRRGPRTPKALRALWILLAVAGATSIISIGTLLGNSLPLFQYALVLEAVLTGPESDADPVLRDYLRIFSNTSLLYLIVLVVALAVIGGRYFLLLLRGLRTGHPRTLNMVRRVAQLQLFVEAFGYVSTLIIFSRLEVIQRSPSLGLGLLIAPVILYVCRRPAVKAYFSHYEIERVKGDGTPVFAPEPKGGDERPRSSP